MSKRGAEGQGGEDRYGNYGNTNMPGTEERPTQATAAQLARRKILQAKGRPGGRSRQASPAITSGQQSANPFQAFQPPPSADGFNFSVAGSTPAPSFGGPQQNGIGSAQQNGTPSFSFGSGNSQPQQNPFNPSTSFGFGNTQNTVSTPSSSFGFAQQSQQQNGGTPSFTFGQSQQDSQPTQPSAPSFGAFGQSTQTNATGTGLFGSTPPPTTDVATKAGESIFSTVPKANGIKPGMFTQSQANGEQASKSSFTFGQSATQPNGQQTPKPSNPFSGVFGGGDKEKEGQTPQPAFAANPSFTGFGQQAQTNGDQASKPSSNPFGGISFGQQSQEKEDQTSKPMFGGAVETPFKFGAQQAPKPTSNVFGQPQTTSAPFGATNQDDTSMLSPSGTPQKQGEAETPTNANAGKSLFDRISRDPRATAPKLFSFGGDSATSTEPSASQGKSLFDRMTPREQETPATAPKPSSASFAPSTQPSAPPLFSTPTSQTAATSRQPTQARPSLSSQTAIQGAVPGGHAKLQELNAGLLAHLKSQDTSKDWTAIFEYYKTEAAKLTGNNVSGRSSQAPAQAAAPSTVRPGTGFGTGLSKMPPYSSNMGTSGNVQTQAPAPPGKSDYSPAPKTPAAPAATNIFSQASKAPATAPVNRKRSAEDVDPEEQPATEKRARPNEPVQYPRLPENASNTAKLFASTLDKPAERPTSRSSGLPWNAPMGSDRPNSSDGNKFGPPEDVMARVREQKAAKEAAQKAEAEKALPTSSTFTPSTTFKFGAFAAPTAPEKAAETPKAPTFGFIPATPSANGSTTNGFKPSFGAPTASAVTEKAAETPKAPTFGFTPATPSANGTATGGFKPTFSAPAAGSNNFLAAFGQKAMSEEEKAKKKRMEEDYDSEEDDRDAWEAKDREEQEAKRKRIEEAAKNAPVFSLPTSAGSSRSNTPFQFKVPSAETNGEKGSDSNSNAGKSLFDRITPAVGATNEQTPKPSANPFSSFKFSQPATANTDNDKSADKAQPEKEQGTGDNTWKPSTPIKFGASMGNGSTTPAAVPPANPFAGLFGSKATPAASKDGTTEPGKLAPPSLGFTFGAPKGPSSDVSRATTPGVTTDGEASTAGDSGETADGPSEEQNDKQVEDMTALQPAELEQEDVLFQVPLAKGMRMEDTKDENGEAKRGFVEKGKGPLYILKNKTTGRTRILLKVPPLGRVAMNFNPREGLEYIAPGGGKQMSAWFHDQLETDPEKARRLFQWVVRVKEASDAKEMARILTENRQ